MDNIIAECRLCNTRLHGMNPGVLPSCWKTRHSDMFRVGCGLRIFSLHRYPCLADVIAEIVGFFVHPLSTFYVGCAIRPLDGSKWRAYVWVFTTDHMLEVSSSSYLCPIISQNCLSIGCATSVPDVSSPRVYVRVLTTVHRLNLL
jgi:hypothetical protein